MTTAAINTYSITCTGDACTGDTILFSEAVYAGSFRRPKYLGERRVAAHILKESYGQNRQQHTFTLLVVASDGVTPFTIGDTIKRKGRNVYKNGTVRLPWPDEADRRASLDEKHARGTVARADCEARRMGKYA